MHTHTHTEPFSKDGRQWFERSLDKTYYEFLSKVAMGRAPQVWGLGFGGGWGLGLGFRV
jgi:hypothetical protein